MLNLAAPTEPAWIACALDHLDEVLLDHAHCEKKAAGTAVQLLFRYPEHAFLHEPLSRLAREELLHFEEVLAVLRERGVGFARQRPAPYAGRLRDAARPGEPERLLDTLLCAALIEARSCERFGLLAGAVSEPRLRALYQGLLASEARHHGAYLALARQLAAPDALALRLAELAQSEARALAGRPRPRMHG